MEFFNTLMDHSEVKLSILNQYTIPWMRKITLNPYGSKKCLIIDGFAGKGKYDNGKDGSPIILLKNAMDYYDQSINKGWSPPSIFIYLNELDPDNYNILTTTIRALGFSSDDGIHFHTESYETIYIKAENKSFEEFMIDLLSDIKEGYSLIPSFCFVDPFGFSTTPFRLFIDYLKNNNSEVLLNFIYEETNRFINHPSEKIRKQIGEHIGLVDLNELTEKIDGLDPKNRKQTIIETYTNNILKQTNATYIRTFEMKKRGRTKLILFHITKNINGLKLMKETMWKHDETGAYVFDDRKKLIQLDFDEILNNDRGYHQQVLSELIFEKFTGQKAVHVEDIEDFIAVDTIYPKTNFLKPALNILEDNDKVFNITGRKKRRFYPKNTRMDFK